MSDLAFGLAMLLAPITHAVGIESGCFDLARLLRPPHEVGTVTQQNSLAVFQGTRQVLYTHTCYPWTCYSMGCCQAQRESVCEFWDGSDAACPRWIREAMGTR